jgi:hypothetical protein
MISQKRYERLGWQSADQVGVDISVEGLQTTLEDAPKWIDDRVWNKSNRVADRSRVAILYFALEDYSSVKAYAVEVVPAADEFFFGSWRSKVYKSEEGKRVDADCLRRQFDWMESFEAALLWSSVLGEWEFLKKLGTFPKPDSQADSGCGYGRQFRDLYLALGAFLSEAPEADLQILLDRAAAGPKTLCKLAVSLIRAGITRDAVTFQKELIELLKYYKKNEFPKDDVTKTISFEGTFFVHWAEKVKIPLTVPPEFDDHIVRLK